VNITFQSIIFTYNAEAITAECEVATWHEYSQLQIPSYDSLMNNETKILQDKILIDA
jgi:hypothetical protein